MNTFWKTLTAESAASDDRRIFIATDDHFLWLSSVLDLLSLLLLPSHPSAHPVATLDLPILSAETLHWKHIFWFLRHFARISERILNTPMKKQNNPAHKPMWMSNTDRNSWQFSTNLPIATLGPLHKSNRHLCGSPRRCCALEAPRPWRPLRPTRSIQFMPRRKRKGFNTSVGASGPCFHENCNCKL